MRMLAPGMLVVAVGCHIEHEVDPQDHQGGSQQNPQEQGDDPPEDGDDPTEQDAEHRPMGFPGAPPLDAGTYQPDEPSDYIYDEEEVEALLSLEQVELGIEEGIATALSVDPALFTQVYSGIIGTSRNAVIAGEDDCPYYVDYYYTDYGYFYWYDTCTSEDDVSYSGYALGYDYSGLESGYYIYPSYAYVSGSGSVTDAEGYTLDIAGSVYAYEYIYAGYYRYSYGYVIGNFAYDNPEYEGSWLDAGLSANLTFVGQAYLGGEPSLYFSLVGSLSGMTGEVNTIVLTDTYIYTESLGSECGSEPSGTISVRDSAGEWYDVDFQGPPYAGASVFPADCDGCGQVWYRGEYLGDVCPDFSALNAWEDRPW